MADTDQCQPNVLFNWLQHIEHTGIVDSITGIKNVSGHNEPEHKLGNANAIVIKSRIQEANEEYGRQRQ